MSANAAADVDRELARLRLAVRRITTNLLELEQHPTKALLDVAPLRGTTAARWTAASALLAQLFGWTTILQGVLDRAIEVRAGHRVLDAARAREVDALLHGPSIELSDTTVPFHERPLLGTGRVIERCTPEELTERMGVAFEDVKRLVLAVDEAWGVGVPRAAAARAAAVELEDRSGRLGGRQPEPLVGLQASLDEISDELLADPLAIDLARLHDVEVALERVRLEIEEGEAVVRDLDGRIDAARRLLGELDAAIAAGADASAQATEKIAGADVAGPLPTAHSAGDLLEQAIALVTGGELAAGAAALVSWWKATAAMLESAQEVERRNRLPLDVRNELRGRLDAFHAKAAGLGRLEDDVLQALFDEARAELYTAPTDLVRAEELVRRYQQALAGPSGSREVGT